ncbi:unnamed protein product [[Actinomadura] parvosata subsp. kistnae]|uniref:Glutathionylspermidine synthase pre-ATP-grasp-like domain-containing protein n=1 Tax=[Actinomadura] parvosata subsp. kistnae TaxID=1909395 RepID=A0A1V0A076_9ACTN|nr:hypothetical protein [Nonomuraea sp. ATCC 55076]AQZ63590.1 hypothetical protein BKM31_20900 [Nonomuraea sp. ATCC 55076]SPL99362.1 unnamed protein product [Actinomadura parvosata subsp. kistnae]
MQTLEQRINALNSEMQAYAREHATELAEYFDDAGDALSGLRDSRLSCCVGERMPVPPALLPKEVAERFARCHRAFQEALDLIFDGRLRGSWHRLAQALRLEEPTFGYVDPARRPRWMTIARPDVVIHDDDLTMVEPNAGSSCGYMPDADILGRLFEQSLIIGDFLRKRDAYRTDVVATLAAYLRERLVEAGESPAAARILVIEFKADLGGPCDDCHGLSQELRRHGLRAEAAAVEDLDVGDGGVAYKGERCSLLYRVAGEEPDPIGNYPLLAPILEAGRAGRVVIVDDLDDAIALNKTILATVSEELDAGTLPARLRDVLATFVPWTRVIEDVPADVDGRRVDLLKWCADHRESLVLKPGAGYGGRGVTIGCETDSARWLAALDEAVAAGEAWMVQRIARSHPTMASIIKDGSLVSEPTYVDYGYFAVGAAVPAAIVRKSPPFGRPSRRVKNGGCGPVFVV